MGRLNKNFAINPHIYVDYKETDNIENAIKEVLKKIPNRPEETFYSRSLLFNNKITEYKNRLVNIFYNSEHFYTTGYTAPIMTVLANKIFDIYVLMFHCITYINDYNEIINFFEWFLQTTKNFGSTDIAFSIYENIGPYKELIGKLKEKVTTLFNLTNKIAYSE